MSSQTGSLAGGIVPFDLNSQSGVMQLLASIRASELSPVQKNELRDLVFLYSNGGGDATVRLALLQKLETYKIVPVVGGKSGKQGADSAPAPVRPFGASRPAPAFTPITVRTAVSVTAPLPPPVAPSVPVPPPVVAPPPPVYAPPVAPVPVAAPMPTSVAAVAPPAPAVSAQPSAWTTQAVPANTHLERIRFIKQVVNQKVGNPVNLVDIDNTVGREYMMALLEAMKKVGGGMPGDLDAAMRRLEDAFSNVEKTVAAHAAELNAPAPQVPTPVAPIPVAPVVPPPQPVPQPIPQPAPLPPVVDQMPLPVQPAPQPIPQPIPQPAPAAQFKASSLADDPKKLLTPRDLPDAATLSTGTQTNDPLHTKEVDTGLDQLLLEWDIFKKSGLFGTGPKGIIHPLFKELAPLTIPLILAGRYDGATQQIRQSVTDYMNGWRYEQGLVYEQEETFEQYLRRVIRHIIDLQKRRGSA